ncbi:hypothetical protein ACJX0J_016737, partial [Zea mays]
MVSEVAGQGARLALRWTAVIGGLGGLEEGHYAAYIKGTPGEKMFMTDEDVAVIHVEAATGIYNANKCATLDFYAFPYLRTDMLHLTDIILFLVCAYDANLANL